MRSFYFGFSKSAYLRNQAFREKPIRISLIPNIVLFTLLYLRQAESDYDNSRVARRPRFTLRSKPKFILGEAAPRRPKFGFQSKNHVRFAFYYTG